MDNTHTNPTEITQHELLKDMYLTAILYAVSLGSFILSNMDWGHAANITFKGLSILVLLSTLYLNYIKIREVKRNKNSNGS